MKSKHSFGWCTELNSDIFTLNVSVFNPWIHWSLTLAPTTLLPQLLTGRPHGRPHHLSIPSVCDTGPAALGFRHSYLGAEPHVPAIP